MAYFPHYKHDLNSSECTARRIADSKDMEATLRAEIDEREREDKAGMAALAVVLSIANDPKWAGKAISSVKARLLKAYPGWRADLGVVSYLVSPDGARVHVYDGILDKASIERANTCWSVGAPERLAKYDDTRRKIPAIVEAMRGYIAAAYHLSECCHGTTGMEYDPITAAGILACRK